MRVAHLGGGGRRANKAQYCVICNCIKKKEKRKIDEWDDFSVESPATTGWIKLLTKEVRQRREMTGMIPEALCFWQWRRGKRDFCHSLCFKTIARCFLSTCCIRGTPCALPCFPSGSTVVCVLLMARGLLFIAISCSGLTWEFILIKSSRRTSKAQQGFCYTKAISQIPLISWLACTFLPSMVKKR